jgi:hypothetical protein
MSEQKVPSQHCSKEELIEFLFSRPVCGHYLGNSNTLTHSEQEDLPNQSILYADVPRPVLTNIIVGLIEARPDRMLDHYLEYKNDWASVIAELSSLYLEPDGRKLPLSALETVLDRFMVFVHFVAPEIEAGLLPAPSRKHVSVGISPPLPTSKSKNGGFP